MARWVFKGFNQSGYLICVWRQIIINERLNPVELSYGARNVLSYTGRTMQNFLSFRDSPIIPLRRLPYVKSSYRYSATCSFFAPHSNSILCAVSRLLFHFFPSSLRFGKIR